MSHNTGTGRVTDMERREFLRVLGVTGSVATGVGLGEVREAMTHSESIDGASMGEATALETAGRAVRTDLAGSFDSTLITSQQASLAAAASELPAAREQGVPVEQPRNEFEAVAAAARPVYEHLGETDFFERTTEHLPTFDPAHLEAAVETFVGAEAFAEPLSELGLTGGAGVDLLSEVIANAERLSTYHWVATDEIPRAEIELGEHIPSMTRAAAGGVLLWLEDLDQHLWQKSVLLTPDIHADVTWHARSMVAGFQLMIEGAREVASESRNHADDELGALLSTGFAVQAIAQNLLVQDGYLITEEMRAPRTGAE
jgi:hypothetical protein